MKSYKKYMLGLALAALARPAWAQVPAVPAAPAVPAPAVPPPPGAVPVGLEGVPKPGGMLGNLITAKEYCKAKFCASSFGQLFNNSLKPVSVFSGGIIPNCCPPNAVNPADLAKPADDPSGLAARIKADEAAAAKRRADVRYLGTVDCRWWPEAQDALVNALRADKNECVRWEAAMALGSGCCCTPKTVAALTIVVSGSEEDGNPAEWSERVKAAAHAALLRCCDTLEAKLAPVEPPPVVVPPPETPKPETPKPETPKPEVMKPDNTAMAPRAAAYYRGVEKAPAAKVVERARKALAKDTFESPGATVARAAGMGRTGVYGLMMASMNNGSSGDSSAPVVASAPVMASPAPHATPMLAQTPPAPLPAGAMKNEPPRLAPVPMTPSRTVTATTTTPPSAVPATEVKRVGAPLPQIENRSRVEPIPTQSPRTNESRPDAVTPRVSGLPSVPAVPGVPTTRPTEPEKKSGVMPSVKAPVTEAPAPKVTRPVEPMPTFVPSKSAEPVRETSLPSLKIDTPSPSAKKAEEPRPTVSLPPVPVATPKAETPSPKKVEEPRPTVTVPPVASPTKVEVRPMPTERPNPLPPITVPAPVSAPRPAPMPASPAPAVTPTSFRTPAVAVPGLVHQLRTASDAGYREVAATQLGGVDWRTNPQVVEALVNAAERDASPAVQVACVNSLSAMGVDTIPVVVALQNLKEHRDPRVQMAADRALTKLTTSALPMGGPTPWQSTGSGGGR